MSNFAFIRRSIRWMAGRGLLNWVPDELFLRIKYWACLGKKLNLDNPKTFNEKLQWLKINDRKPEYSIMVDKYEIKKVVGDKIGEQYIIPTLGVWDRFEDIDFEEMPEQFVLKCTHDSGGIAICLDKKNFDIEKARRKINRSLKKNYYNQSREWPYKNVKPRIIAEQYIEDTATKELRDYKIMCFNGKAKCSFVCTDRYSSDGLKVTFFDRNWNKMPFERHYPSSDIAIEQPQNYSLMIEIAEKLSSNIPFSRIDFYEVNGKVYFGEITFYPGSGFEEFTPINWDYTLGEWLKIQ